MTDLTLNDAIRSEIGGFESSSADREETVIQDWMGEIQKVARKAANDWPGVVQADDLAQEVCLHILERPGTVRNLAGMDQTNRYRTLHKIAQRIASGERDDYDQFSGNFRYSVDEVRSLLEQAGDPERSALGSSWSVGGQPGGSGDHSDPTGAAGIGRVRISEAHRQLADALDGLRTSNSRYYEALVRRFVEGEAPKWEDGAARKVIDRALVSLTTKMNHGHKRRHVGELEPNRSLGDGPGTRRVIRNSTARFVTKDGYDADYMPMPTPNRDNHIEPEVG